MLCKIFSPAQELKLLDLFQRIAETMNFFGQTNHRDTYKGIREVMRRWTLSANADTTIQWREEVERHLLEMAGTIDAPAFRNLNNVRPIALWKDHYRRRNDAIREACFAFTRQFNVSELTRCFKEPLIGKNADFIIVDDLEDTKLMPPGIYTMTFDRAEPQGDRTVLHWKILSSVEDSNEHDQEVIAMFNNVKTVNVQFANDLGGSRTYSYLTDDDSIVEGDAVIVEGNQTLNLVTVKSVEVGANAKATKWVVQKVDTTAYKERQRKIARAKELKQALDAEVERQRKMIDYSKAFEGNEEMLKLVAELKSLQS